jgi:hypothetical protein
VAVAAGWAGWNPCRPAVPRVLKSTADGCCRSHLRPGLSLNRGSHLCFCGSCEMIEARTSSGSACAPASGSGET